jgi:hypothetical protein
MDEGIGDAENGSVRADAESKCQYCNGGEARILAQHAQAVPQILDKTFDETGASGVAAFLFGAFHAAKLDARTPERFFALNSAAHQILSPRLDVEAQLRIHLAFHPRVSHDGARPGTKAAPKRHISSGVICRILAITV